MAVEFPSNPTNGQTWDGWIYDSSLPGWRNANAAGASPKTGLTPVAAATVTVGTGTASVNQLGTITFSGASYIQLNNVFTSSYKSYRILAKWDIASGTQYVTMTAVSGGTSVTTANYYSFNGIQSYGGGTTAGWQLTDPGSWWIGQSSATVNGLHQSAIEVHGNPVAADRKGLSWTTTEYNDSAGYRTIISGGTYRAMLAFDGFRITVGGSTFSGTITVYGYNS